MLRIGDGTRDETKRRRGWRSGGLARGAAALAVAASLMVPAAPAFAIHLDTDAVTVDDIAEDPATYYGRTVMVDGEVGEMLGQRSFTLEDSDILFDEQVPVVASRPLVNTNGQPIDVGVFDDRFVQVIGTVHQFNVAAFEDRLGIDLDDHAWQAWRGRPAIIATHVMVPVAYPNYVLPAAGARVDAITVDDITDNPAAYAGQTVRVSGEVEEIAGAVAAGRPWAFALEDSDFLFDEQVLVLGAGPRERAAGPVVDAVGDLDGNYVWVTGKVRTFNIAEVERELGVDLDDAIFDDWEGQAAIVAQSIRTAPVYPAP